ncbi:MAG: indolepyruvate ferredoxin oxidoreductase [Phycisphaera sp.]|nr:indolepyruvate ferredoxin oxidoreductase [Phycisphaera sp.]
MKVDPRFLKDQGHEVFTGNELLVKGCLEAQGGVHLFTGYPGSPVAGFFDCLEYIAPLLDTHGMVARLANNEAISVAMVNGAQMAGCRAITAFKSVGLHVASDALALGVMAGTRDDHVGSSGGIIVCGDDPWSESTQVPADSRFLAEHVRLPMLEPSSPQEVKDWIDIAFKLGRAGKIYIGYMMTVALADGGGSVECHPNHYPTVHERQKVALSYQRDIEPTLEATVLLPPRTGRREVGIDARFAALKAEARKLNVNRVLHAPQKGETAPLGFIAAGNAFAYLAHALTEMGLWSKVPVLKLGLTYPVDEQIITDYAKRCEKLVVIEERRPFVERQVLEIIDGLRQTQGLRTEVYGKKFPGQLPGIPSTRGLNPSLLIERLAPLLRQFSALPSESLNGRITAELDRLKATTQVRVNIPDRTPTFCPGCPHRDSSSVLLELRKDLLDPSYMTSVHKREVVDLVAHGDTGCYTMLMFEPTKPLMHNYSGMGLGGATGSGADPFISNKQLVFMGDGTFFHSGQVAISHSIKAGQDITYIILDNKTTAMTGHQTHPGVDFDLMGRPTFAQDIERIVKAMIPKELARDVRIVRINPADRSRYRKLLEQTILSDGVKIVIADKECGITFHRKVRKVERDLIKDKGFLPKKTFMNVATEVCEYCLECTQQTGCPGLTLVDTDYGRKVQTDSSWCVNDGACHRIHACPSFEEVTIHRKQAPRMGDEHVDLTDLPQAPAPIHALQDTWRCHLAGVGGMGIGLCTAILVTAGNEMGYHVQFLDKKGMAIRNGGVFSQLVYSRIHTTQTAGLNTGKSNGSSPVPVTDPLTTPLIPYGKADLLLGVDLLEAARAIDPAQPQRVASPGRTAAVVNTAKTPTILTLMGKADFDPDDVEHAIQQATHPDHFVGFNVGDLCERMLDTKLYANIMMLGIAFQRGLLPLHYEALQTAIRQVARQDTDRNLRAFEIGRKIAVRPDLFTVELKHEYESARQALRRKTNTLRLWFGKRSKKRGEHIARHFRVLMRQTFRATRGIAVDDALMRDVIIRAYDCVIWGGLEYAKQYCDKLVATFRKDTPEKNFAITRAVVWNLAKVMLIKDEVYVSALLTSPEKYKRDRRRFNINPERGDRVVYKHHNRPEFEVFGRKIRFEWKSRDWELRAMSNMCVLRNLLPGWHKREKLFRDGYAKLVDQLDAETITDPRKYQQWLAVLSTPANVTGYREVRYPKMDAARTRAAELLAMDSALFEPAGSVPASSPLTSPLAATDDTRHVELPIFTGV